VTAMVARDQVSGGRGSGMPRAYGEAIGPPSAPR
jgi:hypothetical protein